MALTPAEQAQLDALVARAQEPGDADADDVIDAAGDVAAEVGAATADGIATAAAAVAAAVGEQNPDRSPEVIMVESPTAEAEAAAAVIAAEYDGQVKVIDATVDAELRRVQALRELDEVLPEQTEPAGNIFDDVLGPVIDSVTEVTGEADSTPEPVHRWFRNFGGRK